MRGSESVAPSSGHFDGVVDLVGAITLAAFGAFHQRVGEACGGVTGGVPDLWSHEDCGIEANHVGALVDEGAPPVVLDVASHFDAEGAVIVGGGEAAVDFTGLEHEAAPLGEGYYGVEVCHVLWIG